MKKILLIDDEDDFSFFVKANLEAGGKYTVLTASNGKDGLRMTQEEKPDLILLDIIMPGMDGIEVLKKLKQNDKTIGIPVVMITARGDEETKMEATTLYSEDYIVKPIQMEALKLKIDNIIDRFSR